MSTLSNSVKVQLQDSFSFFSTLPDEMVTKIFSYLNLMDIFKSVMGVSHRLRRLCSDSITYIDMDRSPKLRPSKFVQLLPLFPRLKWLRFSYYKKIKEAVYNRNIFYEEIEEGKIEWERQAVEALRLCPMLEGLTTESTDSQLLFDAIKEHGKSLRRISVRRTSCLDPISFAKLTHIELRSGKELDDQVLVSIGKECRRLESFEVRRSKYDNHEKVSDEAMKIFLHSVKSTLKKFNWTVKKRTMGDGIWVRHLSQCHNLVDLTVMLQKRHMRSLLEVTEHLPALRHLGIGTYPDQDPSEVKMKMASHVTSLSLAHDIVTDAGLAWLGYPLTDSSLVWFTRCVQSPGFRQLDLDGFVTDFGFRCLLVWCGGTLEVISIKYLLTLELIVLEMVKDGRLPVLKCFKFQHRGYFSAFSAASMEEYGVEVINLDSSLL